jgi:hypothetical protein
MLLSSQTWTCYYNYHTFGINSIIYTHTHIHKLIYTHIYSPRDQMEDLVMLGKCSTTEPLGFLRLHLTTESRLALNYRSSCPFLLNAGIIEMHHYAWLITYNFKLFLLYCIS